MKQLFNILILLVIPFLMSAQKAGKTKGVIVQCKPKHVSEFIHSIHQKRNSDIKYKSLGSQAGLFLLTGDLSDATLYDLWKDHPLITAVEYNYVL